MAADPTGEDALWAEARSLLDRAPTESAEQRLGRWRRTRVLAVVAALLSGTAVVLVVAVLFRDALGERPSVDVPSWRAAAGFGQRATLVANVGLGIAFTGQWIASPARWRAVLTGVFALVVGISWVFLQRDARRARRFLDEHPVVGTTPAE